jgi:S1-C subfamily serine protease
MNLGRFSSEVEEIMSPANDPLPWQGRLRGSLRHLWARGQRVVLFASGVVAALVALLIYQALTPAPKQLTTRDVSESIARAFASATPLPAFSEQVYRVVQPSLVLIQAEVVDENGKLDHAVGSGVIINEQGDILTSLHVVTHSNDIQLTFADGTQSSAQVTVAQPENDIAVLSANTPPAQIIPATLGNPNAMRVGDEAFAVGNPFGLYGSMSAGVISGFDRSFKPANSSYELQGLIQIDAAVNPGNSGGPLLNRYGEVIGIVTGLVNPTEQNFFVGIGFAVPIDTAAPAAGAPNY